MDNIKKYKNESNKIIMDWWKCKHNRNIGREYYCTNPIRHEKFDGFVFIKCRMKECEFKEKKRYVVDL